LLNTLFFVQRYNNETQYRTYIDCGFSTFRFVVCLRVHQCLWSWARGVLSSTVL